MEQTLDVVEFIFVDDATPDGSIDVLQETLSRYTNRAGQCQILKHETNLGLPAARNTGLATASGEYIFHCDSDDFLEPTMLEKMYNTALKADADIAWCDFYISFEKNERYMKARDYKTAEELVRRGFLAGDMKYNVWNKLVKRSLYDGIEFPAGHSMGEDMTMIMLAAKAQSVAYVPEALYHYVKTNTGAYTQTMSERSLEDIQYNTARTIDYLFSSFPGKYEAYIPLFKLNVKLPFLISDKKEDYRRWKEWFPESNSFSFANKELPFRTKLLQWMASHGIWCYVRAYNALLKRILR